ncbi:MAG: inositol monophosphatase family protein [Anaerolineae bacterium]
MLQLAIDAARAAGKVLLQYYGQAHTVHTKGLRDISTEADIAAEQAVVSIIQAGCPDARIIAEESYQDRQDSDDAPIWYIDPLGGTTNYARGLPEFSVSVAMARNGIIQCGAIYEPLVDQLFYAARGQGSFLNGQKLSVSTRSLSEALVLHDWPRQPVPRQELAQIVTRLAPEIDCLRSRGSAALGFCAIAAGWAEAYLQLSLQPWDVAAGIVIVEEAGGLVSSLDGQPYQLYQPSWLASNGVIHEQVVAICR